MGQVMEVLEGVATFSVPNGDPIVPNLEHFFKSLIELHHKLVKLGFCYSQAKVSIVEQSKEGYDQ